LAADNADAPALLVNVLAASTIASPLPVALMGPFKLSTDAAPVLTALTLPALMVPKVRFPVVCTSTSPLVALLRVSEGAETCTALLVPLVMPLPAFRLTSALETTPELMRN
jgi:hypothetical protein